MKRVKAILYQFVCHAEKISAKIFAKNRASSPHLTSAGEVLRQEEDRNFFSVANKGRKPRFRVTQFTTDDVILISF